MWNAVRSVLLTTSLAVLVLVSAGVAHADDTAPRAAWPVLAGGQRGGLRCWPDLIPDTPCRTGAANQPRADRTDRSRPRFCRLLHGSPPKTGQ